MTKFDPLIHRPMSAEERAIALSNDPDADLFVLKVGKHAITEKPAAPPVPVSSGKIIAVDEAEPVDPRVAEQLKSMRYADEPGVLAVPSTRVPGGGEPRTRVLALASPRGGTVAMDLPVETANTLIAVRETTSPVQDGWPEPPQMYEGVEYEHLKKYVLTFAHFDIYAKNPICTLAVRKPKGTMHEGLINLPGGKIKEGERPSDAAIRELLEETGVQGSFPQYMGRITNGRTYDVMVYRCIAPSYGHPAGVHEAHGHEIHNVPIHQLLRSEETLPNVTLLLSLCAGGIFGWEIRDGYEDAEVQQDEFDEYSSMIFNKYYSGRVFFDRTKNHVPAI